MKKRTAFLGVVVAMSFALIGCNESTDASKELNDAYHNKTAPSAPTGDQMKPKGDAHVGPAMGLPTAENPGGNQGGGPPAGGSGPAGSGK